MYQLGFSISSMLGGLFSRWVDSAHHSRWVPCSNQNKCKQNSPRIVVSWWHPLFRASHGWCLLVVGEYKLYHSAWEPPIMCVALKISRSLVCYVDNESIPLKTLFTSISKSSSGTLQIPASLCEGPIHLLLCWVITLLLKSTSWRAPLSFASITINLYWVWLWLDLFYHELQCLASLWSLKVLCIYVLRPQKGLARYHLVISRYDCFEKVLSTEIYYYCMLVVYAIDMSKYQT